MGADGREPSKAAALNDHGQVVGSSVTKTGYEHASLWQNGAMRDLGTLGGPYSLAVAINERGQIIGQSTTSNGLGHAILWTLRHGA